MASAREYFQNKKNHTDQEYKRKLILHKAAVFYRVLLILIILAAVAGGIYIYLQNKVYKEFRIVSSVDRTDTVTTKYTAYAGQILKYSMDGAAYIDAANKNIWAQTYEMQNPLLDICDSYVAIADTGGNTVYVMNESGLQGQFNTKFPIVKIRVSGQGVVYALMEEETVSWLNAYSLDGKVLAEGKFSMSSSGYPLDFDVSTDGKKISVSFLYVDSGVMKTNVAFYNFGSVGQNKIDNLVSGYEYDAVFPMLHFANNDTCIAVGDDRISIFKGRQKPELAKEVTFKQEIKSAFCSGSYICLVFDNTDNPSPYRLEVYNLTGEKVLSKNFNLNYNDIQVSKNTILISGDSEFAVYNLKGLEKFRYRSEKNLLKVIPSIKWNQYIVLDPSKTETIGLKLN